MIVVGVVVVVVVVVDVAVVVVVAVGMVGCEVEVAVECMLLIALFFSEKIETNPAHAGGPPTAGGDSA